MFCFFDLLLFVFGIFLVSHKEDALLWDVFFQSLVDIVVARFDGGWVGEIEYANTALRAFIVGAGEGFELLLSCGVPDLQRIGFAINLYGIGFEIYADGGEIGCVECVFAESEEDGAFADCLWADDDDFEGSGFDVLVRLIHISQIYINLNLTYITSNGEDYSMASYMKSSEGDIFCP